MSNKYYAAFFPDLKNHSWLKSFRKSYDPNFKYVNSHITLVNPTQEFTEDELKDEISKLTKNFSEFFVTFRSCMIMPE